VLGNLLENVHRHPPPGRAVRNVGRAVPLHSAFVGASQRGGALAVRDFGELGAFDRPRAVSDATATAARPGYQRESFRHSTTTSSPRPRKNESRSGRDFSASALLHVRSVNSRSTRRSRTPCTDGDGPSCSR
jgi:hypothetical protein